MQRHVTIKDIANALNISKSTVSRALADRFDVNPETRKAVLEMAEKLHYKPNPSAQPLPQPPHPQPQSRMRMMMIQRQPLLFPQNMENTLSPCHICAPAAHGAPAGR